MTVLTCVFSTDVTFFRLHTLVDLTNQSLCWLFLFERRREFRQMSVAAGCFSHVTSCLQGLSIYQDCAELKLRTNAAREQTCKFKQPAATLVFRNSFRHTKRNKSHEISLVKQTDLAWRESGLLELNSSNTPSNREVDEPHYIPGMQPPVSHGKSQVLTRSQFKPPSKGLV